MERGIALEDQTRIFDKFVQIHDEDTVGGTGLGLTICREIVRAHKGTIWVESKLGEGSVFTFTLPVCDN
jgi:NtrC-family two-component system sensor histidine kinase KinB